MNVLTPDAATAEWRAQVETIAPHRSYRLTLIRPRRTRIECRAGRRLRMSTRAARSGRTFRPPALLQRCATGCMGLGDAAGHGDRHCRHRLKTDPLSPGTRPAPRGQFSTGVDTACRSTSWRRPSLVSLHLRFAPSILHRQRASSRCGSSERGTRSGSRVALARSERPSDNQLQKVDLRPRTWAGSARVQAGRRRKPAVAGSPPGCLRDLACMWHDEQAPSSDPASSLSS